MSTTTIRFTFAVDGAPADATSVVLRDPSNAFGVRRADTLASVVPPGTAMARLAPGVYAHAFADPAPQLLYNYWVEAVHNGATYRFERNLSGPPPGASRAYLTLAAADALAAALPPLPGWAAATADERARALERASVDVDTAFPFQGRKYNPGQPAQFPRAAQDAPVLPGGGDPWAWVWDWDPAGAAAVVPEDVLLSVLFQADAALLGERDARLAAQHDGVVYAQTGSLAESYKQTEGPGVVTGLCRPAWLLMRKYRLKGGRLL